MAPVVDQGCVAATDWPETEAELDAEQLRIAAVAATIPAWRQEAGRELLAAAVFVAYPLGLTGAGRRGDPAHVAAVVMRGWRMVDRVVARGQAGAPYAAGYLALRDGRLIDRALRALREAPDVVLVDATGRDHPRRAGLALHLGAVLDVPTIGVTDRPLLAAGPEPTPERGASAALHLEGELVGYRLRTRGEVRPLVVHAAWRTDPQVARDVVLRLTDRTRTPEPLRQARRLARTSRGRETRPSS